MTLVRADHFLFPHQNPEEFLDSYYYKPFYSTTTTTTTVKKSIRATQTHAIDNSTAWVVLYIYAEILTIPSPNCQIFNYDRNYEQAYRGCSNTLLHVLISFLFLPPAVAQPEHGMILVQFWRNNSRTESVACSPTKPIVKCIVKFFFPETAPLSFGLPGTQVGLTQFCGIT